MFTACKHSCISSSLSLSRELSRFWENNPDHVTRGISGFSLQCYIHIHKEGLRNKLLSVERERCGCLLSGTEGLLCVLGNAGLEARPAASGIPPHRNIFPAAVRLLNSSSAPPPKKKDFFLSSTACISLYFWSLTHSRDFKSACPGLCCLCLLFPLN